MRGTLPSSSMISAIWSIQQTVARKKTDKTNRFIRQWTQSQAHSGWVGGGQREREVWVTSHTPASLLAEDVV